MNVADFLTYVIAYPIAISGVIIIWSVVYMKRRRGPRISDEFMLEAGAILVIIANIIIFVADLLTRNWVGAGMMTFWTALIVVIYFRNWPRDRKKIRKLIGSKAKAIRARIVKKFRDARNRLPRPGLKPLPVPV